MNKAEKILLALREHLNLKNYQDVADFFGIKRNVVYSWVRHDNISQTGKILAKLPYINLEWLETGSGPMAIIDKNNIHLIPNSKWAEASMEPPPVAPSKIIAQIEPGKTDIKQKLLIERQTATEEDAVDDDDIEELQRMSLRVLRSKTVYRSAWASNCRAFYQAVIKEEEMATTKEEIKEMRAEISELRELLKAFLGPNQKREQKAG